MMTTINIHLSETTLKINDLKSLRQRLKEGIEKLKSSTCFLQKTYHSFKDTHYLPVKG